MKSYRSFPRRRFAPLKKENEDLNEQVRLHEDKVSDACDAAIGETADIIDQVFSKIRYAMQQCRDDVTKFCSSVERGQGRVFACLNEQKTELSGACLDVIENVSLPKD